MKTIKEILIERDGMSPEEADALIEEATTALHECVESGNLFEADEICYEYFGLEPDYLMELI